jgi:hypothetical protein
LKYAFPEDPAIDFVYRNSVADPIPDPADYKPYRWRVDRSGGGTQWVLEAILSTDYDDSLGWDEALQKATENEPLTFFCDGRGQLITRSEWSRDALWFLFQPEHIHDGHSHGERGTFTLSALGRIWAENFPKSGASQLGNSGESRYYSVVLIDDMGQGLIHTPPGRSVAFKDMELATFLASDAKDAYTYRTQGREKVWEATPNDHRLRPSPVPWMNLPWGKLIDQLDLDGRRMDAVGGDRGKVDVWNPVQRAFRTAGLVRGKYPYVLIIDDIQKDDEVRDYKWLMQIPSDLVPEQIHMADFDAGQRIPYQKMPQEGFVADIVLRPQRQMEERLLVRVLDCNWRPNDKVTVEWPGYVQTYQRDGRNQFPSGIGKRLVIPSRSVAPGFKVLLFPYRDQKNIPGTKWNKDRTQVTITVGDQKDVVDFTMTESGRTAIRITRNGKDIFRMD